MAIVNSTRTIAGQCMSILRNITDYVSVNGETHRDKLALVGRSESKDGLISGGFFRSDFNQQFNLGQEVVTRSDGTVREVILKYLPRAISTEVFTDFTGLCTAGSELQYNEHAVNIDSLNVAGAKITIEADNWDKVCESIPEIIGRRWMAQCNAINQKMDLDLAGEIIAGTGANGAHTAPTTVPDPALIAEYRAVDLVDTDDIPIWAGSNTLRKDMAINEITGIPTAVLFGHENAFGTFVHAKEVGCCNDKGVNIADVVAKTGGFAPFSGRQIKDAFTAAGLNATTEAPNAAVFVHPGSTHLIEYFDFDRAPYQHGQSYGATWQDPISGEVYDVKFEFVPCGSGTSRKGQYVINLYKQYKAFVMPLDQFKTGDTKENQNGVMLYNLT